jgi:hypothetical protein
LNQEWRLWSSSKIYSSTIWNKPNTEIRCWKTYILPERCL